MFELSLLVFAVGAFFAGLCAIVAAVDGFQAWRQQRRRRRALKQYLSYLERED